MHTALQTELEERVAAGRGAGGRPDVSVVVPVYRNAETLEELYRRLRDALEAERTDFEMIFVDDACPAGSLAVLKRLAQHDRRVAALVLARNSGQHRAVLAGLSRARGNWAVVLDADLQDPPEVVPALLRRGEEARAPVVFAGRRGRYESRGRLLSSRLFKRLLHIASGVPVDAGLFVALRRDAVERLLSLRGPEPFVTAMIGCARLSSVSVSVERSTRPSGSSAYSSLARLRSARRAFAWVLAWKLRRLESAAPRQSHTYAPVREFVGAGFEPEEFLHGPRQG